MLQVYGQFRDEVMEKWRTESKTKAGTSKAKGESGSEEKVMPSILAVGSMARCMFKVFNREFLAKSVEKLEELMRFTFKQGESLKAACYIIGCQN